MAVPANPCWQHGRDARVGCERMFDRASGERSTNGAAWTTGALARRRGGHPQRALTDRSGKPRRDSPFACHPQRAGGASLDPYPANPHVSTLDRLRDGRMTARDGIATVARP